MKKDKKVVFEGVLLGSELQKKPGHESFNYAQDKEYHYTEYDEKRKDGIPKSAAKIVVIEQEQEAQKRITALREIIRDKQLCGLFCEEEQNELKNLLGL